jgi:hypothetical protein
MKTEKTSKAVVTAILRCVITGNDTIEDQRYETSGLTVDEAGTLCYCIIDLGGRLVPAVQFIVDAVISYPENKK